MQNLQADTDMRENIAGPSDGTPSTPKL